MPATFLPISRYRTMTTTTQASLILIRDLINRFIDHPESLKIEPKEHPGFVSWVMQGHADDLSKLVGKGGAHYYALKRLITEIGKAQGMQYALPRYLEPLPAPRQDQMIRKKADPSYDARPASDLLTRLVENIGVGQFGIELSWISEEQSGYHFTIIVRDVEDYTALTVPPMPDRGPDSMTIIGAIGTLFRAYANRDGTKFELEVARHA